uniref:Uncharacterized protein n=1 Tax=viral metagenome TaxID=1070528 RepID=A0A6C0LVB5_9ZZZZ
MSLTTRKIVFSLVAIGLVVVIIVLLLFFNKNTNVSIQTKFNTISDTPKNVGGILSHLMVIEDFEKILSQPEFSLSLDSSGISDCSAIHRKTCAAWTYMRKDLPPMLFIFPTTPVVTDGYWTPNVGILIDPNKAWSLLTTMGVIDSATNERSCCSNEDGYTRLIADNSSAPIDGFNKCDKIQQSKYSLIYSSNKNTDGGQCKLSCDPEDEICRAVNSGGGVNWTDFHSWDTKDICKCLSEPRTITDIKNDLNSKSAQNEKADIIELGWWNNGVDTGDNFYTLKGECSMCTKPYFCSVEDGDTKPYLGDNGPSVRVGKDGHSWNKIFGETNDNIENIISTMMKQCKFKKENWPQWVTSMKDYYNMFLRNLNKDNILKNPKDSYMQANPCSYSYFENEVNMYIQGDQKSNWAKEDNEVFRSSIMGFVYIDSTCEEQLKPLINSPTNAGKNCKYTNNKDRCKVYLCGKDGDDDCKVKGTPMSIEIANRTQKAKELTIQMVKKFNQTYKTQVEGFSCTPASNLFMNYDVLQKASNGEIDFDSIFHKII